MQHAHSKESTYNSKEILIILFPDAIIQPSAVMIKTIYASVALSTMLWWILHM